jgi:hypothetical protein
VHPPAAGKSAKMPTSGRTTAEHDPQTSVGLMQVKKGGEDCRKEIAS